MGTSPSSEEHKPGSVIELPESMTSRIMEVIERRQALDQLRADMDARREALGAELERIMQEIALATGMGRASLDRHLITSHGLICQGGPRAGEETPCPKP